MIAREPDRLGNLVAADFLSLDIRVLTALLRELQHRCFTHEPFAARLAT